MGGPLVGFSAEGVSSSSCLCPSTCEKAGSQHSSCARPEDENFEARVAHAQDGFGVEEIGLALAEVMQVYDDNDEGKDLSEDSDENEDSLSVESDSTDGLVDVDTELVTSSASLSGNASESSIGKSEDGDSVSKVTPVLVSAMKGSRAKRGIVTNLSVSWAPDVYDPPVTSDSHTVRPHHRSLRKSNYKYKPPKGSSSSRSSSGSKKDKKHSHHSSSSKRDKKSSYRSTSGSSRTDTSDPQHLKAYDNSISSRTDTSDPQHRQAHASSINSIENTVPEYHKLSLWLPPDSVKKEEAVSPAPVLKSIEPIKRSASSCKEAPLSMLSRQFVAAKYKGMFSFWGQNQLAS
ncbi:uncharacterized protein [Lolium perenne]|uniref:uncharacterized protein n=1 Tax=Lolium perenne TaxID=4522 RepID=UPI0021F6881D|nr:uncharacterized protein LOC127344839 [Lolium perenne]